MSEVDTGAAAEAEFIPKPLESLFDTPEAQHQAGDDDPAEVQAKPEGEGAEGAKPEGESPEPEGSEAKAEEAKPDVETGEEPGASPSPDDPDKESKGLLAALTSERGRRQAAEAELEAHKAKPASTEATTKPEIDLPSIYDGEGKFQEGLIGAIKATVRQEAFNVKLASSQKKAVKEHGEGKVQKALDRMTPEMAKNPKYVERFRASDEPFMEIVAMAEDLDKAEKLNDPEYVSKWEAERSKEIEVKIRAELEGKAADEAAIDNDIPESLSGSRSKGDLKTQKAWSGPKPLTEIVDTK